MNGLEFVASLIDSLVWPLVAIVAIVVLRNPLGQVLLLLESVKYKDLHLRFRERLQQATVEASQLPGYSSESLTAGTGLASEIAPISPRAAVIEAWRGVESEVLAAAHSLGTPFLKQGRPIFRSALRALEHSGRLNHEFIEVLDGLRELRNEASHARDFAFTVDEALEFVALCESLAALVRDTAASA